MRLALAQVPSAFRSGSISMGICTVGLQLQTRCAVLDLDLRRKMDHHQWQSPKRLVATELERTSFGGWSH